MPNQQILEVMISLAESIRNLPDVPTTNLTRMQFLEVVRVMKAADVLPHDGMWNLEPCGPVWRLR